MDNNFGNDILQICRTCMKEITSTSAFFNLDYTDPANIQLTIRQRLYSCIPELDLSIISNPIICSKCVDNLLSIYEFKKNCLQSEIQINKYVQQVQHTGDVNLVEVVQFHQLHIKSLDIKVKIEDIDITEDFKKKDLVCDTSAFNEADQCTESTEPKYHLKLEKVEMQDVLFNTFDDYNINYNLSATEESSDARVLEVIERQDKNLSKANTYYQCYKCGHKAESKLKLILHLKCYTPKHFHRSEIISKTLPGYHKSLFYYRCTLCNYLTKYKHLFEFHNRIHLTKNTYNIQYKHIFKHMDIQTKAILTSSKINKTNIKGNKRKRADHRYNKQHRFRNRSKYIESKQHLSHHNSLIPNIKAHIIEKSFKCSICEYQSDQKDNLNRHMRIHTGEKPFSCSVCEFHSSRKDNLKQHIMQIHAKEKPFTCSMCEYQCNQKHMLKRHVRIHTGEKPFSCSVCEYQCNRKDTLKQHMCIHTREKPFSCSVCAYQFNRKSQLKLHMRTHTGEKPFLCLVCEFQCSRKDTLKQHMRIHTGEKPFSCSVCEHQCSRKQDLKQHMRIHTGEKPFSCLICEYQCSQKSNLKLHMRIHTGEKPFSCSVCEYQFSQKSHLKLHMQIHTGEKPFSCSICEYQCSQKIHLKLHMRTHMGKKSS